MTNDLPSGGPPPCRSEECRVRISGEHSGTAESARATDVQVQSAPTSPADACRTAGRIAAAAVLLAAAAWPLCIAAASPERGAALSRDAVVYAVEEDGLRLEFNAVMGTETLLRAGASSSRGRAVLTGRPHDVERLRGALLRKHGVPSLGVLREPHGDAVRRLSALGYL